MGKIVGEVLESLGPRIKSRLTASAAKDLPRHFGAWHVLNMAGGVLLPFLPPFSKGSSLHEKLTLSSTNALVGMMTMGMSPFKQGVLMNAIPLMAKMPGMTRAFVRGYRSSNEARTSAAVPFSHTSINSEMAFQSMQYSLQVMNDAHGSIGSSAGLYSARFMGDRSISY